MWMHGRQCSADEALSRSEDVMLSLCEGSCCADGQFETIVRATGRSFLALERPDAASSVGVEAIGRLYEATHISDQASRATDPAMSQSGRRPAGPDWRQWGPISRLAFPGGVGRHR